MRNTKFWMAVGTGAALLLVLGLVLLAGKFSEGIFIAWLAAFVAVPTQYGIANVRASGQAAKRNNGGAGLPGS